MTLDPRSLTESEVTFVVFSGHARQVLEQIGRMTAVGGLRMRRAGLVQIHDRYFDTADRLLRSSHWALRIRETGSECFITLKGPGAEISLGGVERTEFEAPWSREVLRVIVAELAEHHIVLLGDFTSVDASAPADTLARLGLEKIQDRQTSRQVLEIMPKADPKRSPLAEVDLDAVIYFFHNRKIRHYEIEIEAKGIENQNILTTIVEELMAIRGSSIRRWNHSKLATGLAIEQLLAAGCLVIQEKDAELIPKDYGKIDAFLKRR